MRDDRRRRDIHVPRLPSAWAAASLALAATFLAVATYPRLYAYPKAVVYPAAIWALASYATRPATSALVVAGLVTGTAFLLRHDHGVYAAFFFVSGIALFHRLDVRGFAKASLIFASVAALVVTPWFAWVLASGYAGQYWRFLTSQSQGLAARQRAPEVSLGIDRSQPFLAVAPIWYPRVGIHWATGLSLEDRRDRERRYGLEPLNGDDTYRLTRTEVSNVRALVQDPVVADTDGIDRGSLRVPGALFRWSYFQVERFLPVVRLRVLPGVLNQSNALPWLAWVWFALPAIVLAVVFRDVIRRSAAPDTTAVIVATALLSAITYQTLWYAVLLIHGWETSPRQQESSWPGRRGAGGTSAGDHFARIACRGVRRDDRCGTWRSAV